MQRDPLVELPRALTHPPQPLRRRYLLGVDGGATKTLAAVLDLHGEAAAPRRTPARATRTPSARRPRARRSSVPRDEAIERAGNRRRASSPRRCSLSLARTPSRSRARRALSRPRVLDRRQRRRRRLGHRHRRRARRGGDLRHRLERLRRWAWTGAPGAPAAGAICSVTRALATGSACSRSRLRCATARRLVPQTALSDAAPAFFGRRERRGARQLRLLKAAHQGRDRGLRDRDGQARGAGR